MKKSTLSAIKTIRTQLHQLRISGVGTKNESNRISWLETKLKEIPAGLRILDAGAGEQKYKQFCTHLSYVSQDFAKYDGRGDERGLQMGAWDQTKLDIISDITSIPEPDNSFDAIMCVEVFEHIPEPLLAIKEFARLLKVNGILIITAPFCSLTHFSPYHFYTGYNRYFYEKFLPEYGFEIMELKANGNYFEYIAQEIRGLPEISNCYASARPSILESLSIRRILKMLQRFSNKDKNSSELLNHGLHIKAKLIR